MTTTPDPIAQAMLEAHQRRIADTPKFVMPEGPVKRRPPRSRRHSVSHRAYR
jgi:hypothetical protein